MRFGIRWKVTCSSFTLVLGTACSHVDSEAHVLDSGASDGGSRTAVMPVENAGDYKATVRWTSYGIPHVRADDLGGAAYALGYVESRDAVCILADQIVRLRSERSKYFGRGEGDANVQSDFAVLGAGIHATAQQTFDALDGESRELIRGFVAGYNRYVRETASEQLPAPCRGAPWVKSIDATDMWAYIYSVGLYASVDPLLTAIAAAAPPTQHARLRARRRLRAKAAEPALMSVAQLGVRGEEMGSNGWAIGRDKAENGRGMLLANPHFPWQGPRRLYELHITVPGVVDVYGAGLTGSGLVNIGFNRHVAWTHTVTTADHFTVYRLALVPGKPTSYVYDGQEREMTSAEFSIEVKAEDGSMARITRTLYRSHYGPMLNMSGLGWSDAVAYSFRDANERNLDQVRTILGMNRAQSLQELEAVYAEAHGTPWVNTIATDAEGEVLYVDASRTPALSAAAESAYREALASDPITRIVRDGGAVLLDGSRSLFEWQGRDPRVAGIVAYDDSPRLRRTDFVANANDSHWLSNPAAPLTGYSRLFGEERTPRSPRTRMNLMMLTETGPASMAGPDGKFSFEELSQVQFSNRAALPELLRDAVVLRCAGADAVQVDGQRVELRGACDALERWDLRLHSNSAGAPLFRELVATFGNIRDAGDVFAVGFDPTDPIATPHTLVAKPTEGDDPVLSALGRAVLVLQRAGIAVDASLAELQFAQRGSTRIPVSGGSNAEGAFNIVGYAANDGTLLPGLQRGPLLSPSGLSSEGYPVNGGSSFMLVVSFTDRGPKAQALLSYSQSSDPDSPHFADQTHLFSERRYRPVLFEEAEILADPNLLEEQVNGPRN